MPHLHHSIRLPVYESKTTETEFKKKNEFQCDRNFLNNCHTPRFSFQVHKLHRKWNVWTAELTCWINFLRCILQFEFRSSLFKAVNLETSFRVLADHGRWYSFLRTYTEQIFLCKLLFETEKQNAAFDTKRMKQHINPWKQFIMICFFSQLFSAPTWKSPVFSWHTLTVKTCIDLYCNCDGFKAIMKPTSTIYHVSLGNTLCVKHRIPRKSNVFTIFEK